MAHNIDLAPKIEDLHKGDIVEFNGEYEYNEKVVYYIGRIMTHKTAMKMVG